jgi:hypothetical protein
LNSPSSDSFVSIGKYEGEGDRAVSAVRRGRGGYGGRGHCALRLRFPRLDVTDSLLTLRVTSSPVSTRNNPKSSPLLSTFSEKSSGLSSFPHCLLLLVPRSHSLLIAASVPNPSPSSPSSKPSPKSSPTPTKPSVPKVPSSPSLSTRTSVPLSRRT